MEVQIRIVIADDHRLFREGIRLILHQKKGIEIVGEAVTAFQTINAVQDLKPDVVLLGATKSEGNGAQILSAITQRSPHTKALMLSAPTDEGMIFKSLKAGAKGFLSKDTGPSELTKAIETVHRGELWVERKLMSRFFGQEAMANLKVANQRARGNEGLTPREEEILDLLSTGCTNKEIAQHLYISEKTVKTHLNSIFRKLRVNRRLQAILYAISKATG